MTERGDPAGTHFDRYMHVWLLFVVFFVLFLFLFCFVVFFAVSSHYLGGLGPAQTTPE